MAGSQRSDIDRRAVEHGGCHLAGDEALPDQLVEPQLIAGQMLTQRLRRAVARCRTDRLVGLLGAFGFGTIDRRLLGYVVRAIPLQD